MVQYHMLHMIWTVHSGPYESERLPEKWVSLNRIMPVHMENVYVEFQGRLYFEIGNALSWASELPEVTYCYLVTGLDSNSMKKSGSSRNSLDCGIQIVAFLNWQKLLAPSNVKNASSEMTIWFPLFRHHAAAVILFVSTANIFNWFLWIEITKLLFIIGYWWIKPSIKYVLLGLIRGFHAF